MQNPYSSIAFKIIRRLYPNPKVSSYRMILALYCSGSKNDQQNLCNADKCIEHGDQVSTLQGKIALITGGARGIGFDIAQTLLRNGVKGITIVDNDCECGEKSYACLIKEYGKGSAMFCPCDVTRPENMDCAFRKTIKHFKGLDIVINNAGIFNDKKWENEIAVNIGGCVIGSLLGLQYMSKSCLAKGGVVINIGNTAGIEPLNGCPIYTMTQSAIIGFTRTLGSGCQYQRTGVKIIGLCAGPTYTRMMKNLSSSAINEHFAKELVIELKDRQVQPISFVSNGVLKVLLEGKNGSIWVARNCKEAFQLYFPPSIENMQIPNQSKAQIENSGCKETIITEKDKKSSNINFNSETSKASKQKGNNINIESNPNLVFNLRTGKCPEQANSKEYGPINLYEIRPNRKKFLPEHLSQSTHDDWIQCPSNPHLKEGLMVEPLLIMESISSPKKTASDIIEVDPPSKKRLETGESKELGVPISSSVKPELNPSISETAKFTNEMKDKSKESGHIVSCVDINRDIGSAEEVKRKEHDTIELCEELKNMLSPASKQSQQSVKEACRLKNLEEIQKTQLSFPNPSPEHSNSTPCDDQAMKIEQMDKAHDAKPKVLDCQNKIDKQCSENLKENRNKFEDLCSKMEKLKSKKCTNISSECKLNDKIMSEEEMKKQSDLCSKERDSAQHAEHKYDSCKDIKSSKQLNNCEKDDSKKMDPCQAIKSEKEIIKNTNKDRWEDKKASKVVKNEPVTSTEKKDDKGDNTNGLETYPPQKYSFDSKLGRCKLVRREINNTPLKISYSVKPIPSLLPEHLNTTTTNKSKDISKATQKLPQQKSSQAQTALEKAKNTTAKDTSDKPDHDDPQKNRK